MDVVGFSFCLVVALRCCCRAVPGRVQFKFGYYREMVACEPGDTHPAAPSLKKFQGPAVKDLIKAAGWRKGGIRQVRVMIATAAVGGALKIQDISKDRRQQRSPVIQIPPDKTGGFR